MKIKIAFIFGFLLNMMSLSAQTTVSEWLRKAASTTNDSIKLHCFKRAIQLDPNHATTYLQLGRYYSAKGLYEKAIQEHTNAIGWDAKMGAAYAERGHIHFKLSHWEQAISDFDVAILLNPTDFISCFNRAQAKANLKKHQAAIEDYNKCLEIDRRYDTLIYFARARTYWYLKQWRQVISDCDTLILLKMKDLKEVCFLRGYAYQELKAYCKAIEDFSNSLRFMDRYQVRMVRGDCYEAIGDYESALRDYEKFIEQGPEPLKTEYAKKIVQLKRLLQVPKRLALVIGNSKYQNMSYLGDSPLNDAKNMATALTKAGFEVILIENVGYQAFQQAIETFLERLKVERFRVGLLYYAGHGVSVAGENYLIPTDCAVEQVTKTGTNLDRLQKRIATLDCFQRTHLMIVDACRSELNLEINKNTQTLPANFITCYAASHREAALGGVKNGIYTRALLNHLLTPKLKIETLFSRVRDEVLQKGGQQPLNQGIMLQDFYFIE